MLMENTCLAEEWLYFALIEHTRTLVAKVNNIYITGEHKVEAEVGSFSIFSFWRFLLGHDERSWLTKATFAQPLLAQLLKFTTN